MLVTFYLSTFVWCIIPEIRMNVVRLYHVPHKPLFYDSFPLTTMVHITCLWLRHKEGQGQSVPLLCYCRCHTKYATENLDWCSDSEHWIYITWRPLAYRLWVVCWREPPVNSSEKRGLWLYNCYYMASTNREHKGWFFSICTFRWK